MIKFAAVVLLLLPVSVLSVPFIVQSLSSRYAIILGGYGYQYEELSEVEIVRHDKICHNAIRSEKLFSSSFSYFFLSPDGQARIFP